jgi:hypothetical protein
MLPGVGRDLSEQIIDSELRVRTWRFSKKRVCEVEPSLVIVITMLMFMLLRDDHFGMKHTDSDGGY